MWNHCPHCSHVTSAATLAGGIKLLWSSLFPLSLASSVSPCGWSNSVRAGRGGAGCSIYNSSPNQAKGKDSDHLNLVSVRLPSLIHWDGSQLSGPPRTHLDPSKVFDLWNKKGKCRFKSWEWKKRCRVTSGCQRVRVFHISSAPAIHMTLIDWN